MNLTFEYYERAKHQLKPHELYEISYEAFMKNPMAHLKQIYERLELGDFQKSKLNFEAYISRKHGSNVDRHEVTDEDQKFVHLHLSRWQSAFKSEPIQGEMT
jgi:hypothetical protein